MVGHRFSKGKKKSRQQTGFQNRIKVPGVSPKLLSRIKTLLKKGSTKNRIAVALEMGRKRVDKIVTQLIETKKKGRERVSQLKPYHRLIGELITRGHTISFIKGKLPAKCKKINRSTLWRYIQQNCMAPVKLPFTDNAGEMAYVSVVRIADAHYVYLFTMLLGCSRYGYFCVFRSGQLQAFLDCHVQGFHHFGGAPRRVRLCEISTLRFSGKDHKQYKKFLLHYRAYAETGKYIIQKENQCRDQLKTIKEQILCHFFHSDFKKITRCIRYTYMPAYNFSVHPSTGRSIAQEFKQCEQKQLTPLPGMPFARVIIAARKVNRRGQVYYQGNHYGLPDLYKGVVISLTHYQKNIHFYYQGKAILSCPCKSKNQLSKYTKCSHQKKKSGSENSLKKNYPKKK